MKDLFLDIEALGLRPGAAIVELGAVVFDRETGLTGPAEFHAYIRPSPFDIIDPETVEWHRQQGSYPPPENVTIFLPSLALFDFQDWFYRQGEIGAVWSWGSTYDFPLMEAAFRTHLDRGLPWKYHRAQCARTVWNLAFPGVKHAPRPHHALEDCFAGVADLCAALGALRKSHPELAMAAQEIEDRKGGRQP